MRVLFTVSFLLFLTACSGRYDTSCPPVAIVAEFSKSIALNESGSPTLKTEMDAVSMRCSHNDERIYADVNLKLTSFRNSRTQKSLEASPTYFIALVDSQDQVVGKEERDLEVFIKKNWNSQGFYEKTSVKFPLVSGHPIGSYRILIGFKLDRKQLHYLTTLRNKNIE